MEFTGREIHLIVNALAYSIAVFERLPVHERPDVDVLDMKRMLETLVLDDSEFDHVLNTARTRIENGLSRNSSGRGVTMNQLTYRQLRTLQALHLLETGLSQIVDSQDAEELCDMGYATVLPDGSYRITPDGWQKLAEKQ